jgi:hypothetical protein
MEGLDVGKHVAAEHLEHFGGQRGAEGEKDKKEGRPE